MRLTCIPEKSLTWGRTPRPSQRAGSHYRHTPANETDSNRPPAIGPTGETQGAIVCSPANTSDEVAKKLLDFQIFSRISKLYNPAPKVDKPTSTRLKPTVTPPFPAIPPSLGSR